ncbi:MAG: tetratricopeptide repeat protein [Jaaginema sp. PMC 1079.18]|nr:tetratricopeptide repeat protein [Jaaginema sp. PMC 1080.18]MEC4853572.1 tetratricopeptide repeat protein [Jaaginema sp. PMC 1079.18]MEC4864577.1 tetratricopeptide repeat protein [Jaaginema sp. PMC 1078.18]
MLAKSSNTETLADAIAKYARSLSLLEDPNYKPNLAEILAIMLARDEVQNAITLSKTSPENSAKLINLDNQLKADKDRLNEDDKLAACRQSFQPSESAWWWYLPAPVPLIQKDPRNRYDWIWNTLTGLCLVGATTFMVNTAKAFSTEGFDLMQTFGTVAQGAGLAVVAKGALTEKGNEQVKNVLNSMNIPPHYHAEATFGMSFALLLVAGGINSSLPSLGDWYALRGTEYYRKGRMAIALDEYEEALRFNPNSQNVSVYKGRIYESLEEYDKAIENYKKGMIKGNPAAFHGYGKTLALKNPADEKQLASAKNYLLVGGDLINENTPNRDRLQLRIKRDMGWVDLLRVQNLLNQGESVESPAVQSLLTASRDNLQQAIDLQAKASESMPGWGMSQCYLGRVLDYTNTKAAEPYFDFCFNSAKPETVAEYAFLTNIDEYEITQTKINVSGLVATDNGQTEKVGEVKNAQKLNEIATRIQQNITENWRGEVKFTDNLVYQVTTDANGILVSYTAIEPKAKEFVSATPLPQLRNENITPKRVAKFSVTFTPTRQVTVEPIITEVGIE